MQLVAPLAAGMVGADSGHAEIYQRGTASRSGYYLNAEGTGGTSTADVALDANGRAIVYVNEYVDVEVYDSDGTLVTQFTVMNTDRNTEVISQSFTGQAYAGGGSAASLPVDLQTVLDTWYTSAGSLDFQVSVDGSGVNLQDAIGRVYGAMFNVKEYGAAGDGVTDDRTAILAAQTAADAYGGAVFFPAGRYSLGSTLAWNDTAMVGIPGASILADALVRFGSDDEVPMAVYGMTFATGMQYVHTTGDLDIRFSRCEFDNDTSGDSVACEASVVSNRLMVYMSECTIHYPTGAADTGDHAVAARLHSNGYLYLDRVRVVITGSVVTGADVIECAALRARDLYFDCSGMTLNTLRSLFNIYATSTDEDAEVHGVVVTAPAGGGWDYVYGFGNFNTPMNDNVHFVESGLLVEQAATTARYAPFSQKDLDGVATAPWQNKSRIDRVYQESGTIAGINSLAEQLEYEYIYLDKTDTGGLTIDLDANAPNGPARTVIFVNNTSGAGISLTPSGIDINLTGAGTHTLANGNHTVYEVLHLARNLVVVRGWEDV